jgi:DNA (cytosine-5)-methyltransferase 1
MYRKGEYWISLAGGCGSVKSKNRRFFLPAFMRKGHAVAECKLTGSNTPTFIDIFAGCGGLSLGLMQAGWKGLFALERDENAFQTLYDNLIAGQHQAQFDWPSWLPKEAHDVAKVTRDYHNRLNAIKGTVDLIVGGPPCQGFSVAGRRKTGDPRNFLVNAYIQFVQAVKPRLIVIENVRGITMDFTDPTDLRNRINYSKMIEGSLSRDYIVSSRMLDVSHFGVPQRRRRYFVIGIRKDLWRGEEWTPFQYLERSRSSFLRKKKIATVPVSARSAISDFEIERNGVRPCRECNGFEEIRYNYPTTSYQRSMNCGTTSPTDTRIARHKKETRDRFGRIIESCRADGRLNVSLSREVREGFGLRKRAIRVLDPDAPSPTITSLPDDLIHYSEPRILTVRENARLQSFPDWYEFKGKYTTGGDRRRREVPRYTQVANAVPPLVGEAIGMMLLHIIRAN